jgi:glucose/arabinose dehydrogenase
MLGRKCVALGAASIMLSLGAEARAATTPIDGFKEEVVTKNVFGAISFDWTPDGRMVIAEKDGKLKVRNPNGSVVTLLDLSARVNNNTDRGFTGVAVDSAFATNNYVYLYYTYDAFNADSPKPKTSRVTRVTLKPDNTLANKNTTPETVIVGSWPTTPANEACPAAPTNVQDCIPADGVSHVNGTIRSAPDGTLYIGTGDARHEAQNTPDPFRPFEPKSYAGKILHVDRDGRGLPGHPFCPATDDLSANCTKVFAGGFRNPFRFGLSSRGGLWVSDVGASKWEELDHVQRGKSYGWPCWEAGEKNPTMATNATCASHYATNSADVKPAWAYMHNDSGAAIIGGAEIRGDKYPASWLGTVVAGDFVTGRLNRVEIDNAGKAVAVHPLATGWQGLDVRLGPDGYVYTSYWNQITRIVPSADNRPPTARATVTPYAGLAPLEAHFDGSGSTDPDGDALTYTWSYGDGTGGTGVSPIHSYATNGRYTARLTVTDEEGLTSTAEVIVVVGTHAPDVRITSPATGVKFKAGTPVGLTATATDVEDGTLPEAAVTWRVVLQHNQHQHQIGTFTGKSAQFTPLTSHDSDSYYLIEASAVDSDGVATTAKLKLDPLTVKFEMVVEPAVAAELVYDFLNQPVPFVHQSAVGFETTVAAPETLVDPNGQTLLFQGWSDGGGQTHDVKVPDHDVKLVARYSSDVTPPDTFITEKPETVTRDNTPTFRFTSNEPLVRYQCRIDELYWLDCNSPYTLKEQTLRKHTFEVRAIDRGGNVDATPAMVEFYVVAA